MNENCIKNFERISEYLDGELEADECRVIERHLKDCPECQDCVDTLKKTIALCKQSPQDEIPEEMRKRLRSKLRDCFEGRRNLPEKSH